MLDRSPCGSGTAAIMANRFRQGKLKIGENFENYSIIGSKFTGKLVGETTLKDGTKAVLPEISGRAFITCFSKIVIEEDDPFPEGFTVGDIWAN